MRWKKPATTITALILIILPTFLMLTNPARAQPDPEGTVASTELINFYSMTTGEVTTFTEILEGQGIPLLIVRLNAFSEWSSGTSSGISKAKQIVETANSHGIEVAVDLHTWYTTWDNYFRDSASSSSTNRGKYITYVKNVLNAFASSNVYAFMVMNEPQARKASNSENQFILDVIAAARQVTNKPIGVRFMGGYSPTTGHYSAAIDQACDFICRNTYWDARHPGNTVYGTTEEILLTALDSAHAQSKPFWITEFGKSKSNLEEQRSFVEAFVAWARSKGVDAVFCWVSQPDASGENYNIFTGYEPHPAFYELISGELPPSPPPSPPPEPDILFEDSFESGTIDLWTGTVTSAGETVTVTSNEAYQDTHSVRFTKTGSPSDRESAYVYKRISMQEAYANGYFLIDDSTESQILPGEGDVVYLMLFSDGTQSLAKAGIRREEEIVKWLLNAGGTYVTAPMAVSTDCWYNIELHWNAVEGMAEMFVDGTKILNKAVSDSYKINAISVDIGIISATDVQNQLTVYADCFKLSETYIGPTIPPWDVNEDGCVNYSDAIIFGIAVGSTPETPNWDPRADINSDEAINYMDSILIGIHFGEQYI